MTAAEALHLTVNGTDYRITDVPPHRTLLDWLREVGLTGAKEGCAEGECGACAVLVARPDGKGGTRWDAVNSCLVSLLTLHGQEVITVEGLGSIDNLHPVQQKMSEAGGSQCGYCTPGFVMSMAAEYYRDGRESDGDGDGNGFDLHSLSGNLCRCTGYRPIVDAARALSAPDADDPLAQRRRQPPAPAVSSRHERDGQVFCHPVELREALGLLEEHPDATVLAGGTDLNVDVNQKHARPGYVVAIGGLEELRSVQWTDQHVDIGAGLTMSEVERALDGKVPLLTQLFPQFASVLIRNAATMGGNLGTASPIGDCSPALLALEADVILVDRSGEQRIPLADYFTGYRQTVRQPGQLIKAVRVPLPLSPVSAFYKVTKRRLDDISSVAVGFALVIEDGVVRKARIGLGGVAATPIRARNTEEALEGKPWGEDTITAASAVMAGEGTPISDQRASAEYRAAILGDALAWLYANQHPAEAMT